MVFVVLVIVHQVIANLSYNLFELKIRFELSPAVNNVNMCSMRLSRSPLLLFRATYLLSKYRFFTDLVQVHFHSSKNEQYRVDGDVATILVPIP